MSSVAGGSIIKVHVNEVRQLFNSMDPSPFRERDLDPDCEEFIVSWAREFPTDRPLEVEIQVDQEAPGTDTQRRVAAAVQAHFGREAELQRLRLRRTMREGRVALGTGLLFLTAGILGASLLAAAQLGPLGGILSESMIIGGWVAMWHPMEILLYGLWPLYRERRLLERLAAANVTLSMAA
jgi:hypothetical protein